MKSRNSPELEEERRMFYVGMTRAKERLFVITTNMFRGKDANPSDYYYELQNILEKRSHNRLFFLLEENLICEKT